MALLDINWRLKLPKKIDYGIGIVGCGGIMQYVYLPAYKKAGFKIVACYDKNKQIAQTVAHDYGIFKAYEQLDDLLADPKVHIVDIAVPPWEQVSIVEKVAEAGKHMLCQKPLSDDLEDAIIIVEAARQADVKQAVNHQMRWGAGIAASRELVKKGVIGTPTEAQIQVSTSIPWHLWPWLAHAPKLEMFYHSIHYIDVIRSFFGDPEWITSRHAPCIEQGKVIAENKSITILDYANGLQAMLAVNHYNLLDEASAVFTITGTQGAINGTIGCPDTLEIRGKNEARRVMELDESWVPNAFVGPMTSLMEAIQTDGVPDTSAEDNLNTLRIVFGAYKSKQENRSIKLSEIQL